MEIKPVKKALKGRYKLISNIFCPFRAFLFIVDLSDGLAPIAVIFYPFGVSFYFIII